MLRETAKQEFDISSGQRFKKHKEKSIQECWEAMHTKADVTKKKTSELYVRLDIKERQKDLY